MRLTKLEHSCLILETDGDRLILDPGVFTTPLTEATGVTAVVLTHEHPDHFSVDQLERIREQSPEARLFGTAGCAALAPELGIEVVAAGDTVEVGAFRLEFSGGTHALIHESVPAVENLAVRVNDDFYTAADSFDVPEAPVRLLAVACGAPWLTIKDVMDFVAAVKPRITVPVHEMVLSKIGRELQHGRIQTVTEQHGGVFRALEAHESLDF